MQWNEFCFHIRHLSAKDLDRVRKAFELGQKVHDGQKRRSGEPYFTHPIAVARMLADMGADTDTIIAALLHDTIEDTNLTSADIDKQFDGSVLTLIEGVTKLCQDDVKDRPSLNEQIETLRKMFTLMEHDIRIMVIKLVDRLHNMQTIQFLPAAKQQALAKETQDVYVRVADRLCMQDLRDELESLTLPVLDPVLFPQLQAQRSATETQAQNVIADIRHRLIVQPEAADIQVLPEQKSWENLRHQVQTEGTAVTGVSSVTAVIVCPNVTDCYKALGMLHQGWRRESLSFQDFINSPAINGYRGLHTTIILEDGTRVRCKIRTAEMHEYARKGVTSLCFKKNHGDLAASLPWTARISTLAQDGQERSDEFWQSLQSDILGDSLLIHGPGDESISIPQGSTALDGAFHLFRENALKVKAIRVNGIDVPFSATLEHGSSLDVTLDDAPTVQLSWLSQTRSGLATASIRSALSQSLPPAEKERLGKTMLQETLREGKKGFIEEFTEKSLQANIQKLGYSDLSELYLAIAEGRVDPRTAYAVLFPSQRSEAETRIVADRASFSLQADMANPAVLGRLYDLYRRYQQSITDWRVITNGNGAPGKIRIKITLPQNQQELFMGELAQAGGQTIRKHTQRVGAGYILAIAALVTLWGLDPVLARLLVQNNVTPIDLTVIRFVTFFVFASLYYFRQRITRGQSLKPLSPLEPTLILSGAALFITGLLTYVTLTSLTASQYILIIITGLTITHVLKQIRTDTQSPASLVAFAVLIITTVTSLKLERAPAFAILAAAGSSLGFALYSLLSKRFQDQVGFIRERYPAFLFWLSAGCLIFCIPLLPMVNVQDFLGWKTVIAVLFSLVFAAVPYALYFECMRRLPAQALDLTLPFVVISTIIGEIAVTRTVSLVSLLPLIAIVPWSWLDRVFAGKKRIA